MILTIPDYFLNEITQAVDKVFDKLIQRVTGKVTQYIEGFEPQKTFAKLYTDSSKGQYRPDSKLYQQALETCLRLINAQREITKFKIIKAVQALLNNARVGTSNEQIEETLKKELQAAWEKVTNDVDTIIAYEANNIKNLGIIDSIIKTASANGITDPEIYGSHIVDEKTCTVCIDLYFVSGTLTPKIFKLNEIEFGYHKKGETSPKIGGAHPRCRVHYTLLYPGYGFEKGKVKFIGESHSEFEKQRKESE